LADEPKKPQVTTDEVAGIARDYDLFAGYILPATGAPGQATAGVLLNPDPVLRTEGRGKGIKLYDEVARDPHVHSVFQTRRLAVTGAPWDVLPASDKRQDKKIAEFVKETLEACNFRQGCKALLGSTFKGFAVVEVMWKVEGSQVRIDKLLGRGQHRFVFDLQGRPRLLTLQNMLTGEELPERKFITMSWGSDDANPYGNGLGNKLYWLTWFSKHALKFWMIFCEKFGMPTAVGKYPPGASPEQQQALLAALDAIQQETGIKIPDTMTIDLLEAQRTGSIDSYQKLLAFLDAGKSKCVLGQTLTTEIAGAGSYAASQTQNEVRQDVKDSDAGDLDDCLNTTVVPWLVDFNFPLEGRAGYPRVKHKVEAAPDLNGEATRDKIVIRDIGLDDVPKSYLHGKYSIPVASETDPPVVVPQAPAPFAGAGQAFAEAEKKSPNSATWSRGSGGLTSW